MLTGGAGEVPTGALMAKQARLEGLIVGNRRQQMDFVRAIEATGLRPVIDRSFGLAELADAFRYKESGARGGRHAERLRLGRFRRNGRADWSRVGIGRCRLGIGLVRQKKGHGPDAPLATCEGQSSVLELEWQGGGAARLPQAVHCRGAFGGVLPGVLPVCGGGLVLPAARAWLASLL